MFSKFFQKKCQFPQVFSKNFVISKKSVMVDEVNISTILTVLYVAEDSQQNFEFCEKMSRVNLKIGLS